MSIQSGYGDFHLLRSPDTWPPPPPPCSSVVPWRWGFPYNQNPQTSRLESTVSDLNPQLSSPPTPSEHCLRPPTPLGSSLTRRRTNPLSSLAGHTFRSSTSFSFGSWSHKTSNRPWPRSTSTRDSWCSCWICLTARTRGRGISSRPLCTGSTASS